MIITGVKAKVLIACCIVSACLNIFFLASMGGHLLKQHRHPAEFGINRILASAPPEAQDILKQQFDAHKIELDEHVQKMRDIRTNINRLLYNPQIKSQDIEEAFAQLRKESAATQELIHQTIVESVAKMSPETRKKWSESRKDYR